jgi:hypothetical protein
MLSLDREAILEAIRRLPLEEQRKIAQEIMRAISITSLTPPPGRREPPPAPDPYAASAMSLRGIAKTEEPLEDERLLDESRMERYS